MTLQTISKQFAKGGSGLTDGALAAAIKELQGLKVAVVAGATAGTKINIAAMRTEDTIVSAVVSTDAGGALADDVANLTIQATKASGTLTVATVIDGSACTVNGTTYTFKTTPTATNHVKLLGTDILNANALAAAINAYENRYTSSGGRNVAAVVASTTGASGVVTITSVTDGAGSVVTLTGTVTTLAATNSGTYTATLTCATVVNTNTFAITNLAGTVITFTCKTTPVVGTKTDVALAAGADNTLQAAIIAKAINAYDSDGTLGVVATPVAAAVNISPVAPKGGNQITLTGTVTVLAASGATLANGTATGGIKSTTNLASKTLMVLWFDKNA